ncbi:MAG: aminotransferase class IV [Deltaproteobacteria bacterium]|nr:aminotransferase class IV [Deltaproteobacteria bacterium]
MVISILRSDSTINAVPCIFKRAHMERWKNSCDLLGSIFPHQEIYDQIPSALCKSQVQCCVGKTKFTSASHHHACEGAIDPEPQASTERYVILVKQKPNWNQKFYDEGVHLAIPSVRRNPTEALNPNIKGGNYLNNVLAVAEAKDLGADDAVIFKPQR